MDYIATDRAHDRNVDVDAFDDFITLVYRFNLVTPRPTRECTEHIKFTCSCSSYDKAMCCEHVLAVGLHKGRICSPVRAGGALLTEKLPAGRPQKQRRY